MELSGRRQARILAFQILYSRSKVGLNPSGEDFLVKSCDLEKKYIKFGLELSKITWDNIQIIDETIRKSLINWRQNRLSDSLNSVLRLGVSELMYHPKTDGKVVINETIEICKMYSGEEASSMCNGVLHAVWQERIKFGPEVANNTCPKKEER